MIRKENDDRVPGMRALVERVEDAAQLLVGPTHAGEVGLHRLSPAIVLPHPLVGRDFRITQGHPTGGIGEVAPIVFIDERKLHLLETFVYPARWKKGHVWSIESAGEEKRLLVFRTQLLGDPGGRDVVGELCLLIILRAEVPGAVPRFCFLMHYLIEPLAPLPGSRPDDLRLFGRSAVENLSRRQGLVTAGGKVLRQTDMPPQKLPLFGDVIVVVVKPRR